jgi:hypothetical protein
VAVALQPFEDPHHGVGHTVDLWKEALRDDEDAKPS